MNGSIGERDAPDHGQLRGVVSLCVLVGVLAVTGCSLAPRHETPPLPVASAYPADTGSQPGATSDGPIAPEIAWRDYFADPHLQALIAQALENSRDLRSAVLRVEEVRAAYGIQRAEQFPTIAVGIDGSRVRTPADLSPTGRAQISNQYQVGAGLATWELDFWGRVRNLKDAALETYLATDEARRAITVSLVAQVADGYLALRELDERLGDLFHVAVDLSRVPDPDRVFDESLHFCALLLVHGPCSAWLHDDDSISTISIGDSLTLT